MGVPRKLQEIAQENTKRLFQKVEIRNQILFQGIQSLPLYRCDPTRNLSSIFQNGQIFAAEKIKKKKKDINTSDQLLDRILHLDEYVFFGLGYVPKTHNEMREVYGGALSVYTPDVLQFTHGYVTPTDILENKSLRRLQGRYYDLYFFKHKKSFRVNYKRYPYFQNFYHADAAHLYLYSLAEQWGITTLEEVKLTLRQRKLPTLEIKLFGNVPTKFIEATYVPRYDYCLHELSRYDKVQPYGKNRFQFHIPRLATKITRQSS